MKRIKVLHLITHPGAGGALDNTLLTVEGLPRERYEVHLAVGWLPPEEGYTSWEDRCRRSADAFFLFPDLRREIHLIRDLNACRKLTDFIKQQEYDVVHTHCSKAGALGRLAARRAGTAAVVHSYHAFGWQVMRGERRSLRQRLVKGVKSRMFVWLERWAAALCDRLITVADLNKEQVLRLKIAPAKKISTIHSGINLDRFKVRPGRTRLCSQLGLTPDKPIVGFIGRLSAQKAPLEYIEAAKHVLGRRDVQFLVVGDGPLLEKVRSAISDEPRIRLIGFHDKVPELLATLNVFAMSSHWEGLGRSLTEAMIMNVPVAATAVDGVPELVTHRKTGLLSPPGQPAALAENLVWLLDHPDEARAMARRARRRVVPEFCAKRMVERIDSLYEHLLRKKGLPSRDSILAGEAPLLCLIAKPLSSIGDKGLRCVRVCCQNNGDAVCADPLPKLAATYRCRPQPASRYLGKNNYPESDPPLFREAVHKSFSSGGQRQGRHSRCNPPIAAPPGVVGL